jgi:hypothetical protein
MSFLDEIRERDKFYQAAGTPASARGDDIERVTMCGRDRHTLLGLIDDYEQVQADHRRLVRELDALLNGFDAAPQASLCDIVSQVRRELLLRSVANPEGKS